MSSLPQDKWSTGHGTIGGKAVRFTIDRALDSICQAGTHPYEARFSVAIQEFSADGLPSSKIELDYHHDLEARITEAVANDLGDSHLAVTISMDRLRDIVFYTRNPDSLIRYFEDHIRPSADRQIELTIQKNDWRLYRSLAKAETKKAEPGATDNPDDAQRLREDH